MFNSPINLGLFAAIAAIVAKLIEYNFNLGDWAIFAYFLCMLLAVFFSMRQLRINKKNNQILFSEYFKTGLTASSIFSMVIGAFTWVFHQKLAPEILQNQIESKIQEAKNLNYSTEQIAKVTENAEVIFSPSTVGTTTLFGFMMLGLIYALVTAFLFKKVKLFRAY